MVTSVDVGACISMCLGTSIATCLFWSNICFITDVLFSSSTSSFSPLVSARCSSMDSCVERQQLARNPPQKREQFLRSPSPAYATDGLVADSMYMCDGRRCISFFSSAPPLASLIRAWHNGFLLLLHRVSVCRGLSTVVWLPSSPGRCNFLLAAFNSICTFTLLFCVCVCMTACASSPHLSARARQFVLLFAFVIFFLSSWLSTLRPFFFFFLFYTACRVSVCGSYKENNSARRHREITKMRGERKKKKRLKEKNLTNRDEFKPQLLDGCTDHR